MTITLAVVATIQSVVIGYGLEKFYKTWSRSWVVIKAVFNLLTSKLKKEKTEEKKPNEIQDPKAEFKEVGANTLINFVAKICK